MYSFSLTWFKGMFGKAIELTNVVRPPPELVRLQDDTKGLLSESTEDKKELTRRDRIDLLIQTIT